MDNFRNFDFKNKKHFLSLFLVLFLVLAIPLTVFLTLNSRDQRSKASSLPEKIVSEPTFFNDQVLVKVKKEARGKVKENPNDSGLTTVNDIGKEFKIKSFERVAKAGKDSRSDHDLFSWYLLTLAVPEKKAINVLEDVSQKLEEKGNAEANSLALANIQKVVEKLKADSNIQAVDFNYVINTFAVPNDPYYASTGSWGQAFDDLWGMKKINASAAWDQSTGSTSIVVADIDTGVDRNHEDLTANMWVNSAEVQNNGIDDDSNGYIDDYYGWDFHNNDSDPMDDHGHGTHTVGTIAGVGNNGKGVVGINWISKIMAIKTFDNTGSGSLNHGMNGMQYATDMGARVLSNSWGCACSSQAMDDAVKYAHDRGVVIVTAAGNSNSNALGFSPTNADHAISVAATDSNDAKAAFSNWGEKIDVAAPGVDILSTRASNNPMCISDRTVGTNYCHVSGTSMATPHVAGLAALLLSKNPTLTNEEVRQILRQGVNDLGISGKDSSFGYGRINAATTINQANTHPLAPFITSPRSRTTVFGTSMQVVGRVPGPNFQSYKLEVGVGREPSSWTTISTSNTQPTTDSVLGTVDTTKFNEGANLIRLTAVDNLGKPYQFQIVIDVDNFDLQITSPYNKVSQGTNIVYGYAVAKNGLTFSNYKLEWGEGASPISWSSTGVTLENGGAKAVPIDDEFGAGWGPGFTPLGSWNTASLTDGKLYTLRLTAISANGSTGMATTFAYVDKDIAPGWPKVLCKSTPAGQFCSNGGEMMPVMADLDGDGQKEIIVPRYSRKLYVFRKDGTVFPGFPVNIDAPDTANSSGVNVDDLDGDGKKEIVFTVSGSPGWTSRIYIFNSNGTRYAGWTIPTINTRHSPDDSTVAIGDLNGDGKKELVVVDRVDQVDGFNFYTNDTEDRIKAFKLDGTQITGFPKTFTHPILPYQFYGCDGGFCSYGETSTFGGLLIADVDKDTKPEILLGYGDRIFLFDNQGNLKPGWPFIAPTSASTLVCGSSTCPIKMFQSLGAVADLDGDGALEIFMYAHDLGTNTGSVLYGLRNNGTVLTGWPKFQQTLLRHGIDNTPIAVDLDRTDGRDEVIFASKIYSLTDEKWTNSLGLSMRFPSIVSDLDGDGRFEILNQSGISTAPQGFVRPDGSMYFAKSSTTNPYDPNYGEFFGHLSVVADMDNDGRMEWAVGTDSYVNVGSGYGGNNTSLYLWQIPNTSGRRAQYEWPMFGHDPARTGRLALSIGGTPTPTPTPTGTPDNSPPTTSITAPTGGTVNGVVTVNANATDNVGVTKVELYKNGILFSNDLTSPYSFSWDTTKEVNGTFTLQTLAYDSANNTGVSSLVTVTVANPDTTPPNVTITSPASGSSVRGVVNIVASATDNVGVTSVQFLVDNSPAVADVSSTFTFSWDTTRMTNGNHTLTATAYDSAGNSKTSAPVTVTINNSTSTPDITPPTVAITSPLSSGSVLRNSTVTIAATASDNVGVTRVEFKVDGVLKCTDFSTPYSCNWRATGKRGVTYTLTATAYDSAGNSNISTVRVTSK